MINVWGADHGGYIRRLSGALSGITNNQVIFKDNISQFVEFDDEQTLIDPTKAKEVKILDYSDFKKDVSSGV